MASLHTSFPSLPQSKEDRFYMKKKSLKASTGPVVPGALYAITRQRPTALLHDKVTSWAVTGRTHRSTNKSLRSTHRAAVQWLWTQRDDAQPVATCRRCSANTLLPVTLTVGFYPRAAIACSPLSSCRARHRGAFVPDTEISPGPRARDGDGKSENNAWGRGVMSYRDKL